MEISKERQYWIDAIRSFACLCVITTHAPNPSNTLGVMFVPFYNLLVIGGASLLFFMISGALILYRPQQFVPFMKKRLSRIAFPMFFWSVVMLIIRCIQGISEWSVLPFRVFSIPFVPQVGTFWFIYEIMGIYLLTPVLSTWLAHTSRRELQIYLGIWAITLMFGYFGDNNEIIISLLNSKQGYLYHFYGYLGFAVLGYYLRKYAFEKTFFTWRFVAAPLIVFLLIIGVYVSNLVDHEVLQNRLTFLNASLGVAYFLLLKKIPLSRLMKKIVFTFAQYSFGIYLIHILVIHFIVWPILPIGILNNVVYIPLVTMLTAAISMGIVALIGKFVPGSKYIVGI